MQNKKHFHYILTKDLLYEGFFITVTIGSIVANETFCIFMYATILIGHLRFFFFFFSCYKV